MDFFLDFFVVFFWLLSKLLRLLLNVTTVTTGHQKSPKMGKNSIKSFFFAQRAKKSLGPPLELEVGPRSGPYLLVFFTLQCSVVQCCWCSSMGCSSVQCCVVCAVEQSPGKVSL